MVQRNALIVCGAGIIGGKEIISLSLADGLRNMGWEPEFATSSWNDGKFIHRLEGQKFKYHVLRLGFISASLRLKPLAMTFDQLRYWPSLLGRYLRLTALLSPATVIHTNWHHALLLLPLLNSRRDIFWAHDAVPNRLREACVFRSIGKRVARIVCVSHAVAATMHAAGIPRSKIIVIHNGVESAAVLPLRSVNSPPRFGIVGQIGPWKGHDDLFDALAILLQKGMKVTLKVFGTGSPHYIERLKLKASTLKISESIEWLGFVHEKTEIFKAIDVCIAPSRSNEPLSTSVLEAGSFGRPVICSSRGGFAEIIMHGSTGIIVGSERPNQLADAIELLLHNPILVTKMGEEARQRVETQFSHKKFVQEFSDVISDL